MPMPYSETAARAVASAERLMGGATGARHRHTSSSARKPATTNASSILCGLRLDEVDDGQQYLQERHPIRDLDALGGSQKNQRVDRSNTIARCPGAPSPDPPRKQLSSAAGQNLPGIGLAGRSPFVIASAIKGTAHNRCSHKCAFRNATNLQKGRRRLAFSFIPECRDQES